MLRPYGEILYRLRQNSDSIAESDLRKEVALKFRDVKRQVSEYLPHQLIKAGTPVLVDFYAEWCGPCKMAAPIVDELATEYEGKVKIVKMDVDQNQQTAAKYEVMSIPTMILFKDGQVVDRKVGFGGRTGVEGLLAKAL